MCSEEGAQGRYVAWQQGAAGSWQVAGKLNAICYNLNLSGAHLSSCQYGDSSTSVSGVMAQSLSTLCRHLQVTSVQAAFLAPAPVPPPVQLLHCLRSSVAAGNQIVVIIFGVKARLGFFPNQIKWKMFVWQTRLQKQIKQ